MQQNFVDTSKFAKNVGFAKDQILINQILINQKKHQVFLNSLKSIIDNLDFDKLKTVSAGLKKSSTQKLQKLKKKY